MPLPRSSSYYRRLSSANEVRGIRPGGSTSGLSSKKLTLSAAYRLSTENPRFISQRICRSTGVVTLRATFNSISNGSSTQNKHDLFSTILAIAGIGIRIKSICLGNNVLASSSLNYNVYSEST